MGKIFLILGVLGMIFGGLIALISLLLPDLTRNVSLDEALIGVIAGAVVLLFSFVPAIIGLILVLMRRKGTAA